MNLKEFIAARTNVFSDFDGVYGAQCVDLVEFYIRDVWGMGALPGNAIDLFGEHAGVIDWTRNVLTDLNLQPQPGDIIIWGASAKVGTGVFGHVAVVVDAGPYTFNSFDQNWPVGAAPHIVKHTYDGIVGWGRPKSGVSAADIAAAAAAAQAAAAQAAAAAAAAAAQAAAQAAAEQAAKDAAAASAAAAQAAAEQAAKDAAAATAAADAAKIAVEDAYYIFSFAVTAPDPRFTISPVFTPLAGAMKFGDAMGTARNFVKQNAGYIVDVSTQVSEATP